MRVGLSHNRALLKHAAAVYVYHKANFTSVGVLNVVVFLLRDPGTLIQILHKIYCACVLLELVSLSKWSSVVH